MIDFEKLKNVQDELISFIDSPSTSEQREDALVLAKSVTSFIVMQGNRSVTNIDPTITSTSFADRSEQVEETHSNSPFGRIKGLEGGCPAAQSLSYEKAVDIQQKVLHQS